MNPRPRLRANRQVERAGVNAARTFFERHDQIFQEVTADNDYGKDAYVDFTKDRKILGACAALQIKSGASYSRGEGYAIPVNGHAEVWRESSLPVVGIVHDPRNGNLYWVHITAYLEKAGEHLPSEIPVSIQSLLTATSLTSELIPSVCAYRRKDALGTALRQLCEDSPLRQQAAIADCFALGRHDPSVLIAIRNSLRGYRGATLSTALAILSHAASHPDIVYNDKNWIPHDVCVVVRKHFVWSIDEVVSFFLAVPPDEGYERGTLGQCVYCLLVCDPQHQEKVQDTIPRLVTADLDAAYAAMYLCVYWSITPKATFDALISANPALAEHQCTSEVDSIIRQFGCVNMW